MVEDCHRCVNGMRRCKGEEAGHNVAGTVGGTTGAGFRLFAVAKDGEQGANAALQSLLKEGYMLDAMAAAEKCVRPREFPHDGRTNQNINNR